MNTSKNIIIFITITGLSVVGIFLIQRYGSSSTIKPAKSIVEVTPQRQYTPQATNIIEEIIDVQGSSMQPLLKSGDKVTLQKNYYNGDKNAMKPSDVIIFENPFSLVRYIKKVTIVPDDTVEVDIEKKQVRVNSKPLLNSAGETYVWSELALKNILIYVTTDNKWKKDIYYLLGDNTRSSFDSREYGPVSLEGVLGKITVPEKKK